MPIDKNRCKNSINKRPKLHVVSGPSSAGKSHFIQRIRKPNEETLFPNMLGDITLDYNCSYLLHYNLFRPYSAARRLSKPTHLVKSPFAYLKLRQSLESGQPFNTDLSLKQLIGFNAEIHVTILVVPLQILVDRISRRKTLEVLRPNQRGEYKQDKFMEIIEKINLAQLYLQWVRFLEFNDMNYEFIQSTDDSYTKINSAQEMKIHVNKKLGRTGVES